MDHVGNRMLLAIYHDQKRASTLPIDIPSYQLPLSKKVTGIFAKNVASRQSELNTEARMMPQRGLPLIIVHHIT